MLNICTEGSQNKHDIQKSICNTILQELDHKLRFGKVLLHCSKNNLNFRIKTGLVTAAADATVFVWCLGQKQVSKMPLHPLQSWHTVLGFYAEIRLFWDSALDTTYLPTNAGLKNPGYQGWAPRSFPFRTFRSFPFF